ncbi:MAG: hypothetical protein Kow0025_10340 [Thermodesulfovibrionales bacterium]
MKTLVVWLAMVFVLSIYPLGESRFDFSHSDKVFHFVLYSITCALIFAILNASRSPFLRRHALLAAVVLASVYGLAMETAQVFTARREFSLLDEAANIMGALAAAAFIGVQRRGR